jgi:hypothetical protein
MQADTAVLYAVLTKADSEKRIVEGYITTPDLDRDKQMMDEDFLKRTIPDWIKRYGNVRLMHKPEIIGKIISHKPWDGKGFYVSAKIFDDRAWDMVKQGLLKGFSIGIKSPVIVPHPDAPKGMIVGGEPIEVSLVDVPSNPMCDIQVIKSATFDIEKGGWIEDMNDMDLSYLHDDLSDDGIDAYKRYYSAKERREMPAEDFGDPEHRAFPVKDQEDLDNAARLIGHARNPEAVKRRLIEIAKRKRLRIPKEWEKEEDTKKDVTLDSDMQDYNLEGKKEDKTVKRKKAKQEDEKEKEKLESEAEKSADMDVDEKEKVDVEKTPEINPSVFEQLLNRLEDISAKIEALASQTDKDKDGDIDTPEELEEEREGLMNPKPDIDPNKVEVAKTTETKAELSDEIRELVKTLVAEQVAIFMQQADTQKAAVADETKSLVADVQKRFDELNKTVSEFAERLETVEQMAAPAKGSVMAIEREIKKTSEADALQVVQKFATQLPEEAQRELFKHVYTNQFIGGNK